MSELRIPPHLQVAESVTESEYEKAKWQSRVILITALAVGFVATVILVLFVVGGVLGLAGGGLAGIVTERVMDQVFPEGKKMRTLRVKVYPELRDYRQRQG